MGRLRWSDAHFGYRVGSPRGDLSFDRRDSAAGMPKCQVQDPAFTWGRSRRPHIHWERLVIYELHVRGHTIRHPEVPEALRGTFSGLGHAAVVERIRALGVTAVELLPVQAFVDDRLLVERGLRNYWGYNTIGFFAPDPRYLATSSVNEFKEMVARLHDAGIEVFLDVVYNHTAEGNELGPTLSFKGIDNASYYRLPPMRKSHYVNHSGTGNTLNVSHPRVLQMVTDSLRYWAGEMRVDGFRFDLATILGREVSGFDQGSGFLDACRQDPLLSTCKLIAEPWDVGPGGYQVGQFGPGWAEWNDRYRDCVRSYWRGDEGRLPEFAARLTGSADLFGRRGRRPWASVNFVTAHDGFTVADLVSYDAKHNDANLEGNRDGSDDNRSWNHGTEGPTGDPGITALRRRQIRNMLATLLFSQGVPMLLAGDELGRSQNGNNNAYCQDNETAWVDWGAADTRLEDFVRTCIAIRQSYPVLHRGRFLTGVPDPDSGMPDVTWLTPAGVAMTKANWHDPGARCLGLVLDGRARATGIRTPANDATLLLVANAHWDVVAFILPAVTGGNAWRCLIDTGRPEASTRIFAAGHPYPTTGRSLLLFRLCDRND